MRQEEARPETDDPAPAEGGQATPAEASGTGEGVAAEAPAPAAEGDSGEQGSERYPKPRPPDEPAKVVELRGLIEGKLADILEAYGVDAKGSYIFGLDTARIFVVPAWLKDERTVVRVFAITNLDVPVTPQLTAYLLEKNLDFVLGAFALDATAGAVWFNHNLLGEYIAADELEATLVAVAQTANALDNEIKELFGGRLYSEDSSATVSPPHTPGYL